MSSHVFLPLILLLSAASAGAVAAPRTGEAEVRETSNGLPCFTISEREERRGGAPNFQAISVYEPSARARVKMWTMAMPAQRTFPVLFSMCIPYAGRVQSLPQTAAASLEPGKVYEVYIDARPGESRHQPRGYSARFCLAKQRDGKVVVQPVGADARNANTCGAPK